MSYDVLEVVCEGGTHHKHPAVPIGAFHRRPHEHTWALSGVTSITGPAALAAGERTITFDGDTPVPPSAGRVTRRQVNVQCPVCGADGRWRSETVQGVLSALLDALGRPAGPLYWHRSSRIGQASFQLLDGAVERSRPGVSYPAKPRSGLT